MLHDYYVREQLWKDRQAELERLAKQHENFIMKRRAASKWSPKPLFVRAAALFRRFNDSKREG